MYFVFFLKCFIFLSKTKGNFANCLADGTSVSTRVVWLNILMVILILFTSSYIVIGYLGQIQTSDLVIMFCKTEVYVYLFSLTHYTCRGMKRRDLLLRRYWRREDDGTYGSNCFEEILKSFIQKSDRSS